MRYDMKRIEIYLDKNGILTASEFKNYNLEYENSKISGYKVIEFINKLCKFKIEEIVENEKMKEITIQYKNYIVNLKNKEEYDNVFNENKKNVGDCACSRCSTFFRIHVHDSICR